MKNPTISIITTLTRALKIQEPVNSVVEQPNRGTFVWKMRSKIAMFSDNRSIFLFGIFLIFLFASFAGVWGVDYGNQWDQSEIAGLVKNYVRTGNLLPGWYIYPPVSTYIASVTIIPYVLPFIWQYGSNWFPTQQYLLDEIIKRDQNYTFLLNMRKVFVVTTMLGILWVGLAAIQHSPLAGLVAAAALGLSWEVNYHSRIVSPDGLTMAGVALTLLFCMLAFHRKRPFPYPIWLGLAGMSSAIATATKYTAGVTLISVLILSYFMELQEKNSSTIKAIVRSLMQLLIFVITFILFVPGVVLETDVFVRDVSKAARIYATGWSRWQSVEAGVDHLYRIFLYLSQSAFSYFHVLAFLFLILALLGVYSLLAKRNKLSWYFTFVFSVVPLIYICYFSLQRIMFVRNLLVIFPYLAILVGIGFEWLWQRITHGLHWRRVMIASIFSLILLINAGWIGYAAWTIRMRGTDVYAKQALDAIRTHTDQSVYITPKVLEELGTLALPPNATREYNENTDLVLWSYFGDTGEKNTWGLWYVNKPDASPEIYGSLEINMDWYASWPGGERFVLSKPAMAWDGGYWLIP